MRELTSEELKHVSGADGSSGKTHCEKKPEKKPKHKHEKKHEKKKYN